MHWLWVFLIGLVVGIVAKLLMPGKDPGGFIITALLGIAGSLLATWLGQNVFGWYGQGQSAGFIASVVGAIILLLIYHLLFNRKAR
ncbi:MAG: GlsB/YeaQ/YmgE family stress response membrane protein [Rhodanobacter sp.]